MHEAAVALVTSDNSAHGYNWTFAFPMILFIVIAAGLYLVCTRPHQVPGHRSAAPEPASAAAVAHQAANSYTASGNVSHEDQAAAPSTGPGAPPAAGQSSTAASPRADDNPSTDHREAGE